MSPALVRRAIDKVRAARDAEYWRFTRQARGSPLMMVRHASRLARFDRYLAAKGGRA